MVDWSDIGTPKLAILAKSGGGGGDVVAGQPEGKMSVAESNGVGPWRLGALLAWGVVAGLLAWTVALYAGYAADMLHFPFGLNYSEGLIWQQALWMFGPHAYPDIARYPFLVFEYPPLYHLVVRGVAAGLGADMLASGRGVSMLSTAVAAGLIGWVAAGFGTASGRWPAAAGGVLAGLLPFTLLPVIAWSTLMRVDMLGLALTYGGIALGVAALRRPRLLAPALLCCVAACYTKQTYLAAPLALWCVHLRHDARGALRAGGIALAVGLAVLCALSWLTAGGFPRHIVVYNVNRFSLAAAAGQGVAWPAAYPALAGLTLAAAVLCWRDPARRTAEARFWLAYLALSTATLLFAGKSGASINYVIEWLCVWCVWIGWLAARALAAPGPLAAVVPLLLAIQLSPVPGAVRQLHATQLSPARNRQAQALLDRLRAVPGPVLSDDMVLLRRAGKEVGLEPAILAELAARGEWREQTLVDMLRGHAFGAVVTAYDPGDPTFDARYLPATQAAMLAAYPRVENFGDYRLRLP
jgi:hypothetical protein